MPTGVGLLERITGDLYADRERIADEMTERIGEAIPEFGALDGPEVRAALRASCLANLEAGLPRMGSDRVLPDAIPAEARDLALLSARLDVPLSALLRSYRIGQAMVWKLCYRAIEDAGPDAELRRETVESASDYLFEYVDRLGTFLTEEYTAERDRYLRSREQRRTQLVRELLDGGVDEDAQATLGYDLALNHVACVVTGPEAEAAVRSLARALDAPNQLVVPLAGETSWAWLGRVRPFAIPERLELAEEATVSIGDPGAGLEGFRRSHREARDAHRVAMRRRGPAVVRYDEVALEALLGDDEARGRAFAVRELRGIDGDDPRSERLRTTLRAYFASSQNASAAAAMLGVHEHTVSYRLRTIEERLGRPVTTRRAELELALRLFDQ